MEEFNYKYNLKNYYIMRDELADMQDWCNSKIGTQEIDWNILCTSPLRSPNLIEFQFKDKARSTEFYLVWSEYLE